MVDPLVEAARSLHPSKVWDDINCRLFTAFWSLSLYDLYVPTRRYDDEISRAKQAIKDLDTDQEMVSALHVVLDNVFRIQGYPKLAKIL